MGKRGPKPSTVAMVVLSTRIRRETRVALEKATERSGLTLSREIESRLRRTFLDEDRAADMFGSARNRRLMQLVGLAMQNVHNPDRADVDWLDDPWSFDQVLRQIVKVLEAVRPEGPIPELSDPILNSMAHALPSMRAAQIWDAIQKSDSSMPPSANARQRLGNVIKAELGEIVERPKIAAGTAGDLRTAAEKLENNNPREPKKRKKS